MSFIVDSAGMARGSSILALKASLPTLLSFNNWNKFPVID